MSAVALMAVGGFASYLSQKNVFYKGVEKLEIGKQMQAAAIFADSSYDALTDANFAAPDAANEPAAAQPAAQPTQTQSQPVEPPCAAGETPVIKDNEIAGCTSNKIKRPQQPQTETPNPAPDKVVVSAKSLQTTPEAPLPPPPPSCESQGKYMYTGEDIPGLLYGMCIDCLTTDFVANGNKCPAVIPAKAGI